jgi:mevalonate kinase
MITIQVPGKVMLSGEYAVLYGGTAVLMPVSRYLRLSDSKADDNSDYSPMIKAALDYHIVELVDYESSHGKPTIAIDSSEFFGVGADGKKIKLGLGLSAAEAVGVIALRFESAGQDWTKIRPLVCEYADAVHRKVQRGLGSGADVAVCALGEPIRFRRFGDRPRVEPIDINQKIPLRLVWTGTSADTREMVADFDDWLKREGEKAEKMLLMLIESSRRLADSWFDEPVDMLFENLDIYASIMTEIAGQADIQYSLPIHNEIAQWAGHHGGRAKPAGAGGGDMVLLIGDLPDQMPANIPISIEIWPF